MDKLEKFITDNREKFDENEPSPDIWRHLMINMNLNRIPKKGRSLLVIFSRAAAVLLIFVLSYLFHEYRDFKRDKKNIAQVDIYRQLPDLKETEIYYSQLVNGKLQQIKPFLEKNPMLKSDLSFEMAELDSIYLSLRKDLQDNIANDLIIEAMIMNYKMRLNILEILLNELKTDQKNDKIEKDGIPI